MHCGDRGNRWLWSISAGTLGCSEQPAMTPCGARLMAGLAGWALRVVLFSAVAVSAEPALLRSVREC